MECPWAEPQLSHLLAYLGSGSEVFWLAQNKAESF